MKYTEARQMLNTLLDELCPGDVTVDDMLEGAIVVAESRCQIPVKRRAHTRRLCIEFWKALNEFRPAKP